MRSKQEGLVFDARRFLVEYDISVGTIINDTFSVSDLDPYMLNWYISRVQFNSSNNSTRYPSNSFTFAFLDGSNFTDMLAPTSFMVARDAQNTAIYNPSNVIRVSESLNIFFRVSLNATSADPFYVGIELVLQDKMTPVNPYLIP